jgi:two-component system, cell cycle sensor histidine kinase and response regulator CckA
MFVGLRRQPRTSRKIAYRFRHSNGSWIRVESIFRNLLDDPSIGGVLVSSREITGRAEVADRAGIFEHVLKSINDPVVITDLSHEIIFRDHSRQRQIEEDFRQVHKAESLSVLVGGIAHNFNNILAIIMGYTSMLEDPSIEREKLHHYVRVIVEGTERGAHLIQQLMTYIKKTPVHYSDVSVNEVIKEKIKMVMEIFPQTILFSIDLDLRDLIIRADKNQYGQVLFNLFLNARDAMPDGGTITVSSGVVRRSELQSRFGQEKDIEYVRVTVSDTGTGMDEDVRSRIFEPFFTTKEVGEGIGLGLSVVHGIVESHHGFIETASTVGEGSTISVCMPLLRINGRPEWK